MHASADVPHTSFSEEHAGQAPRPHRVSPRPYFFALAHAARRDESAFAIEGVTLERCLATLDTPFYVTSLSAVEARTRAYVEALRAHFPQGHVHYALKANFAPAVLQAVLRAGGGVDIVSVGEWRQALRAGAHPSDICFAGVGKRPAEWCEALQGGLGSLNVEHAAELAAVLEACAESPCGTKVLLRLNPCVELETHPHLKTGALDSKFGLLEEQIVGFFTEQRARFPSREAFLRWLSPVRGLHVHIGSQMQGAQIFTHVAAKVASLAAWMAAQGVMLTHFDLGGGLGVGEGGVPEGETDVRAHVDFLCTSLSRALEDACKQEPALAAALGEGFKHLCVALEPGRSIVASSTLLVTRVLYEKSNAPDIHFAYVDAGMNDFPRPAIYGARHAVERLAAGPTVRETIEPREYQVVGPVCESGDVLARKALLPALSPGDVLGFYEAGAYCRSMASHYNLRPLPAELFVRGQEIVCIEKAREHVASESVVSFIPTRYEKEK